MGNFIQKRMQVKNEIRIFIKFISVLFFMNIYIYVYSVIYLCVNAHSAHLVNKSKF